MFVSWTKNQKNITLKLLIHACAIRTNRRIQSGSLPIGYWTRFSTFTLPKKAPSVIQRMLTGLCLVEMEYSGSTRPMEQQPVNGCKMAVFEAQ